MGISREPYWIHRTVTDQKSRRQDTTNQPPTRMTLVLAYLASTMADASLPLFAGQVQTPAWGTGGQSPRELHGSVERAEF